MYKFTEVNNVVNGVTVNTNEYYVDGFNGGILVSDFRNYLGSDYHILYIIIAWGIVVDDLHPTIKMRKYQETFSFKKSDSDVKHVTHYQRINGQVEGIQIKGNDVIPKENSIIADFLKQYPIN